MATHRPAVLASFPGGMQFDMYAYPFKDGLHLNLNGQVEAGAVHPPGHYSRAQWAYQALGPDPDQGVALARGFAG